MNCSYCKWENQQDAKFCANCGKPLINEPLSPQNLSINTESQTANSSSSPIPLNYQGVMKRIIAGIVDFILSFLFFGFFVGLISGQTTKNGFELSGLPAFIAILLMVLYFVIMEGIWGATVGKFLLKIKVVKVDGSPCDIQASLIRNVLRVVDGLFIYLVGIILIVKSDKKQRFGDMIAKTVVVAR